MQLFDSHCHLDDPVYDPDRDAVVQRAAAAGVTKMMIAGVNPAGSALALQLADTYPNCYASVGLHPHYAKDCSQNSLSALKQLAMHAKVRAWGETGLDFNRMYSRQSDQESCFIRQLQLADELGLPLIFHERDSRGRFYDLLKKHLPSGSKGVIHCFSGTAAELDRYLEMGLYIGLTGIVTMAKRGAGLRRIAVSIPTDRLLIETDAPYLTPAPFKNRSRRNEPAYVKAVLSTLAEIRQQDPETLAAQIWENTCGLYKIQP